MNIHYYLSLSQRNYCFSDAVELKIVFPRWAHRIMQSIWINFLIATTHSTTLYETSTLIVIRCYVSFDWIGISKEMRPVVSNWVSSPCVCLYVSACEHHFPVFRMSAECSVAITAHYSSPRIVQRLLFQDLWWPSLRCVYVAARFVFICKVVYLLGMLFGVLIGGSLRVSWSRSLTVAKRK